MTWDQHSPEVWADFLTEIGIDTAAQQAIFALARHSGEGWEEANTIAWKLIKNNGDDELPDKPSSFVFACGKNARKVIATSWGRWYGANAFGKDEKAIGRARPY